MKKIVLLICVVALGFTAQAQEESKKERMSKEDRQAMVIEKLGLSEEQATQWLAVHEKYGEQRKEAAKKNREESRKGKEAMSTELKALLTEEQIAKFDEMREAHKEKGKGRRRGDRKGRG